MRNDGIGNLRMRNLYKEIQRKREKMLNIADDFGLNSMKTLTISQELDELINDYLKACYKKASSS
jgi:hypothetical protein